MEELILQIQPRKEIGKSEVRKLRREGFVPAVVYGEGKKSQPIKISSHELFKFIHSHRLENVIINLIMEDTGGSKHKERKVLIKDIQYDPVDGDIIHIDFHQVSLTKEIQVKVPVEAKGEPVGVKVEGGVLEHNLWELEVECLPTSIPEKFEVDVSNMKIGDVIHIKDISFPPDVKVIGDPEAIVLSVVHPVREEEVPVAEGVETAELQEPEVIKKEKKEEEEETAEKETKEEKEEEKKS